MAGLSQSQLEQFHQQGYLKVEGLLDPIKDLDPVIDEYHGVLDNLAHALHQQGKIASTYSELPFGERVIRIYAETGEVHSQYFDFSLPRSNVRHDTPIWVGPAVFRAMTNARLLDAVESFIGREIYSNPVQHVRIKPPERYVVTDDQGRAKLGATNWHQDNGVVHPVADETDMLSVWFSLTDAKEEHGCLQFVPGSHREGLLTHCAAGPGGYEIPEQVLDRGRAVPVPMRPGDVLFFHKKTCHSSLSNVSDVIRWSFDLRYNPIGQDTGREVFPGFVARSRKDPASELRDPAAWAELWYETRKRMVGGVSEPSDRWRTDDPLCA